MTWPSPSSAQKGIPKGRAASRAPQTGAGPVSINGLNPISPLSKIQLLSMRESLSTSSTSSETDIFLAIRSCRSDSLVNRLLCDTLKGWNAKYENENHTNVPMRRTPIYITCISKKQSISEVKLTSKNLAVICREAFVLFKSDKCIGSCSCTFFTCSRHQWVHWLVKGTWRRRQRHTCTCTCTCTCVASGLMMIACYEGCHCQQYDCNKTLQEFS